MLSTTCRVLLIGVVLPLALASLTEEEVQQIKDLFVNIQKENYKLTSECEYLKKENSKLWADVNLLSTKINDLQQYTRVDNVEIAGIPQGPNEDLFDVLKKICQSIGTIFDRNEISEAHRLPNKQGPPFIIVRFISRKFRDRWLNAAKAKVGNVQDIYPDHTATPFYINQHLTSYKKGLLDMAKRLVNDGVYSYAWVKDGKVYVRKGRNDKVIRVRTFDDLELPFVNNRTDSAIDL